MKKGKEWAKEQLEYYIKAVGKPFNDCTKGTINAYKNVENIINQLDEPEVLSKELPVIPKFVADYIELNKGWSEDRQEYIEDDNSGLWFALDGNSYGMPNSVSDWLFNEEKVETFAKAWLDGFTIANEDKQEVKENFYTFDNAKKWLHDNGFVVFEKDDLEDEVQRMVAETYEAMNEKPVIPQYVADWIESYRKKTLVELINDAVYSSDEDSKCFRRWFHEEMGFESNYSEFLARVWLDGYEVEEEQKYQVIIRDGGYIRLYLCKHGDNVMIGTNDNYIEKCPEVTYLTEKEIKDYDERYFAFAEEVTE